MNVESICILLFCYIIICIAKYAETLKNITPLSTFLPGRLNKILFHDANILGKIRCFDLFFIAGVYVIEPHFVQNFELTKKFI